MRLLLTSAGIQNAGIENALVELLGKPISESDALCIPTASYGHYNFAGACRFVGGRSPLPLTNLGWKSLGLLEVSALASLDEETWRPTVEAADVLLAGGGDAVYLAHHMRLSGLAELLPSLDGVWVGLSAGSMVMSPRIGEDFMQWQPPAGGDETLAIVDFSIFPHLDHPDLPENTMSDAERWAAEIAGPAYAIDDGTAIRVVDGAVDVVSEGHWRFFEG